MCINLVALCLKSRTAVNYPPAVTSNNTCPSLLLTYIIKVIVFFCRCDAKIKNKKKNYNCFTKQIQVFSFSQKRAEFRIGFCTGNIQPNIVYIE